VSSDAEVHRFDGRAWTQLPTVVARNGLQVHGVGTDVWALTGSRVHQLHDGAWASLSCDDFFDARGLWASSRSDLWVVGQRQRVDHWDGRRWRCFPLGVGHPSDPNAIWGAAGNDVWVVGDDGQAFHFAGAAFEPSATGVTEDLADVWGARADEVWAVGERGGILRHDGVGWGPVAAPMPAGGRLSAVWGRASDDVIAVGFGLVLRWDGAAWTEAPGPWAGSHRDVWGNATDTWVLGPTGLVHHDGQRWVDEPREVGPNLWVAEDGEVFSVASVFDTGGVLHRRDASGWSTRTGGPGMTLVWGRNRAELWISGEDGLVLERR
jgi:hypothetical protein